MVEKKRVQAGKLIKEARIETGSIAYRLKCAKTANGLSHFVMYGDVRKDKALL